MNNDLRSSVAEFPIPIAVIGDSDSHSYRDSVSGIRRGGEIHDISFNWIETWSRLRPEEVDFGPYGVWGTSRAIYASFYEFFGIFTKVPRAEDYKYVFARSGMGCESIGSWPYQGRWVLNLLGDKVWNNGLLIIRLGVNDLGQRSHLDRWAKEGLSPEAQELIRGCFLQIDGFLTELRDISDVKVAIIGISHDYNVGGTYDLWPTQEEIENIYSVLQHFDDSLLHLEEKFADLFFIEDRSWLTQFTGDRRLDTFIDQFDFGQHTVAFGPKDEPLTISLADGHASTLASGLWLQNLIRRLNERWQLGLSQIEHREILGLIGIDSIMESTVSNK